MKGKLYLLCPSCYDVLDWFTSQRGQNSETTEQYFCTTCRILAEVYPRIGRVLYKQPKGRYDRLLAELNDLLRANRLTVAEYNRQCFGLFITHSEEIRT